jgi:transketolase
MALGRALAARLAGTDRHVWCLLGDGECQEGEVWESLAFGAAHGVDNVTAFVDHNKAQSDGYLDEVMPVGDLAAKFEAFGWHVQAIDGHDLDAITGAATAARRAVGRPSVIVAHTTKGYLTEGQIALDGSHGASFTDETAHEALTILEQAS